MAYLFDILHGPLFSFYSTISQGETLHGILKVPYTVQKSRCVYGVKAEVDVWVDDDLGIKMFSQILESLND